VPIPRGTARETPLRIGINGFGRMGRLFARAAWGRPSLELVAVNEPHATASTMALLMERDSVHGRFAQPCVGADDAIFIGDTRIAFTGHDDPRALRWAEHGVDLVVECSGVLRSRAALQPHLDRGARQVLVSAAVKDVEANIVVGLNHAAFDLAEEPVVTNASCTTNCLAPVAHVLHAGLGIVRGTATTIHNPTNTQVVIDAPHADPRRARASQLNLIPTSSNSGYAVTMILPELRGRLDSIAVRVPVMNASLVDLVAQVGRDTSASQVNALFAQAAETEALRGILGYEAAPLVSTDYSGDPRSAVVDGLSTQVTDKRLVKVLAWYDNEWGYANRMADLAVLIAAAHARA
jgi:glyceraldehyde 3-phosphate dehydrogenase